MFDEETMGEIERVAQRLDLPAAALLAVVEVESAGRSLARVRGRDEPLIRFEGHYFDRQLSGVRRIAARAAGLAHPSAGKVKNPTSQAARWTMLSRAKAIDSDAACCSVSWGVGQVMGSHWKWLGYDDVDALVAEARSGVAGQVRLMVRFIEKSGLVGALRRQDWPTFARRYNGPAYARNRYDEKMAAAFGRWSARKPLPAPADADDDSVLRFGARGERVRALQRVLASTGEALRVDGMYGLKTTAAVERAQMARGWPRTGVVTAAQEAVLLGRVPALGIGLQALGLQLAGWLRAVWARLSMRRSVS